MHSGLEPHHLLTLLEDDLTPWVKGEKGVLSVAADPWNFLELLAESPSGWRGVLHWDGDENLSQDLGYAGCFVKNRFSVGVTCQKGLSAKPEQSLHRPRAGGAPSLLALVAAVRLRVRSFAFPADVSERFVRYVGCDPVVLPDGTPLAGYRLRFELTAHPEPITAYRNL